MPPVMNRSASQKRTEDAYVKHLLGHTWQQIADELGYRSRQGAATAVARYLDRNPPDTPKAALQAWLDRKRLVRAAIFRSMAVAEQEGDHHAVASLSAALDRNDAEVAKGVRVLRAGTRRGLNDHVDRGQPPPVAGVGRTRRRHPVDARSSGHRRRGG